MKCEARAKILQPYIVRLYSEVAYVVCTLPNTLCSQTHKKQSNWYHRMDLIKLNSYGIL